MPLLPKNRAEWTHSLVTPLFAACVLVIIALVLGGFSGGTKWRYWGGPVAVELLPSLGIALGLSCIFGTGLSRKFRTAALVVAALSTLCGWMLAPALAD
jgi:hypothetical protein